jgi:RNA-binding protein YlmH
MNRDNIDKIAHNPEDRILLAKLWDKIGGGIRRNIPSNTGFLSPRELDMARYLFGEAEGLVTFGGYEGAQRQMLCYFPDYLEPDFSEDAPMVCLRAEFYEKEDLSHRDFLGALMGFGISRESVGDICVGSGSCDFFVTDEVAPSLLQSFYEVGRVKIRLSQIPLAEAKIPEPEVKELRDTLASLRLDSVISSGFRIGRSLACSYIGSGKAAINGLPCEKADKQVAEGAEISVRGLGKIKLYSVNGQTKKGRISVVIHRYV